VRLRHFAAATLVALSLLSAGSAIPIDASPPPPQTAFPAVRLAAGGAHSLGILTNGSVWSWGSNALGQLGDGTTVSSRTAPVPVAGLSGPFVAVAAGAAHSLALRDDGVVFSWGLNSDGQLGDGTTTLRRQAVQVAGLTGVVAVAAGTAHSLALKEDGSVVAWGANSAGQLGDGTTTRRLTPRPVSGLSAVSSIAAGAFHSLAVLQTGVVRAWGTNVTGQLGDGTLTGRRTPIAVSGLTAIVAVSAGAGHSLALTSTGTVKAWGDNTLGQLGDGTTTRRTTPVNVSGLSNATAIAAGAVHSLAAIVTGGGRSWGANDVGQLGDGTTTRRLTPVTIVQPPTEVSALAAGAGHSLVHATDTSAWSWGLNAFGQLGDGSTARSLVPIPIGDLDDSWGVIAPAFTPGEGTYTPPLSVGVSTRTPGGTIHYTTNGNVPTQSDPVVSSGGSIPITQTTTLKARAFKSGLAPSRVTSAIYTIILGTLSTPVADPPAGTYNTAQNVTLTSDAGATIRYTLDGNDPTESSPAYATPISISATTTLKARAFKVDYIPSAILMAAYVIETTGGLPPDPTTVAPPINPTVPTSFADAIAFLHSGANPIQREVTPGAIVPRRAAAVRGEVRTRAGAPLAGVRIAVPDRPDLGHTLSRADGKFDLVVNGGGPVTLDYSRAGFLPAQRTVDVPWNDYVVAPDVRLVQLDAQVTQLDFAAGGATQVARGTPVSDGDGTRQATLIVPDEGSIASLHFPDGTVLPGQAQLSIRATEYTVGGGGPEAMPAALPPASGYTYAVELSADEALQGGATKVTFNPPLVFYLENFLELPAGIEVPAASYDRKVGGWVVNDNGRVVQVVSVTDGLADLDVDGDGIADTGDALIALAVTDGERQKMAALYQPGQSLWRARIPHFSPWDFNLAISPSNLPENPPKAIVTNASAETERNCNRDGSIIDCQNQTLGEEVPITGTPFSLAYRSSRAPGRTGRRSFSVEVTQDNVPDGLQAIELRVRIWGREIVQRVSPQANRTLDFTWDGRDQFGRPVYGEAPADVLVSYEYDGVYLANQRARAFGLPGGTPTTARSRLPAIHYFPSKVELPGIPPPTGAVAGWSLSAHHVFDRPGQVLYRGDGTQASADALGVISGKAADTNGATSAVGADGSVYLLRWTRAPFRLERVTPEGQVETVSTSVSTAPFGTQLQQRLAPGPRGEMYVLQARTPPFSAQTFVSVGRYLPNGVHEGLGFVSYPGFPFAIQMVVDQDGTVYVGVDNRLYRLTPGASALTQVLETPVAEDGSLYLISGLALGRDGSLYWSETLHGNNLSNARGRIYRLLPTGTQERIGGNGLSGFSPDGSLATDGPLGPFAVAVDRDGSVVFTEVISSFGVPGEHRVRRIGTDGRLSTIAGGVPGNFFEDLGDGGPAVGARYRFFGGSMLSVGPDGDTYLEDGLEHVRKISAPPPGVDPQSFRVASSDGADVYEFSLEGRHLRTRNAITGAVIHTFAYDSAGLLTSITDGDGLVTTIQRDGTGTPTAIVAPFGQRTSLSVDANGYLATITDPAGGVTRLTTSPDGLLTEFQDPNGNASTFEYDEKGRLENDRDAAGGSQTLGRTDLENGWSTTVTTALGREHTYEVRLGEAGEQRLVNTSPDATTVVEVQKADGTRDTVLRDGTRTIVVLKPDPRFGMSAPFPASLTVRTPAGREMTATTTRTVSGDATSVQAFNETTTIGGRSYSTSFAGATRTLTTTTPAGRVATSTLDSQGRATRVQIGTMTPIDLAYDAQGRLRTMTQGLRTLTYTYTARGELESITDPMSRRMDFDYDAAGRVTTQTRPDGKALTFGYDAAGNVTSVTPPERPVHGFTFTPVDLLEQYDPPNTGAATSTRYTYTLDRDPETIVWPDGRTINAGYDSAGRLQTVTTPTGTSTFAYDPASGRVATVTSPDASLGYSFDGPLPTEVRWSGVVNGRVGWSFDSSFRVASETVNGGSPIAFTYDPDSLLTGAGALTLTRHPANGFVSQATLGSLITTLGYDGFGALSSSQTSLGGTLQLGAAYTRDVLGRIEQKTETLLGAERTEVYGYDTAGRLTDVTRDGVALASYTYDANGNRLTETTSAGTISATYDAQDRLLTYGSATYTHTAAGERRTKTDASGTTTYTYDMLGNLTGVALPAGTVVSYVVDGANRRIGRRVDGVLTQGFLYQGRLRPVAELNAGGAIVSRFVYATRANVPDYFVRAGVTYRIVADHLGSPRLVINAASGAVVQQLDYDPFGKVVLDSNPGFQPFGFAGGLHDPLTGFVRFGARDYDPETGRWTNRDPIGFAGGDANLYGYVLGDPINGLDPLGLLNVAKTVVGLVNVGRGFWAFTNGTATGLISVIAVSSGVGLPFGVVGTAWGGYQFFIGGPGLTKRGLQQLEEALAECPGEIFLGRWQNILGLFPLGQYLDDPGETLRTALDAKLQQLKEIRQAPSKIFKWLQDFAF
jgi:RHS repeat-associated protein